MADEPSLPPLPAVSWSPSTQIIRTRKRGRDDAAPPPHPSTSSDPAWFSSDDDPSVDNYTPDRRKRRYVGSWFSQTPRPYHSQMPQETNTPRPAAKRSFKRQYDSGVWMGSDTTVDPDEVSEELSSPLRPSFAVPKEQPRASVSGPEEVARAQIRHCLETCAESIDLTGLDLEDLSHDTISPLAEFACIPIVEKEVAFEQKEPSLKLYLSRNKLALVPGSIFLLNNLSVLSIRANGLVELAPAVARLTKLEELNVSQNSLRYLPGQLLDLVHPAGKLKKLHIHPNPYCRPRTLPSAIPTTNDTEKDNSPVSEDSATRTERDTRVAEDKRARDHLLEQLLPTAGTYHGYTARILARSPVHYNDGAGIMYSKFKLPNPDDTPAEIPTEALKSDPAPPVAVISQGASVLAEAPRRSSVPSLFELSLLAGYKTSQLSDIPHLLSEDAPRHVHDAVRTAIATKDEGGRHCGVCGRLMIIPRTAWLEWWEIAKVSLEGEKLSLELLSKNEDEKMVPFLKQGCSWRCVPRKVGRADWIVGGGSKGGL